MHEDLDLVLIAVIVHRENCIMQEVKCCIWFWGIFVLNLEFMFFSLAMSKCSFFIHCGYELVIQINLMKFMLSSAVMKTEDSQGANWENSTVELCHRWCFCTVAARWRLKWNCPELRGNWSFHIIKAIYDV